MDDSLGDRLKADMIAAMKAKEKEKLAVLRMLIARLKDAAINKRDELSAEEELRLISTYTKAREPNVAPKSWVQMVSFDPPILMFSGTRANTTEKNILETRCFGVNIVDSSMAGKVFECLKWHGMERIEHMGLGLTDGRKIGAPLVDDCRAHLECVLRDTKELGGGFMVFGEIVAASVREDIVNAEPEERYKKLDQILFLEDGVFSRVEDVATVKS